MSAVRILAIEDDPLYAESLLVTIEELGYIPIGITDNIGEFIRLIRATLPDVLLIDVDLGQEMDGIQLAQKVGADHDIPFIFVTSYKDPETIFRAKDTFPSAYITKPYEPASLRAAIEIAVLKPRAFSHAAKPLAFASANPQHIFLKEEGVLTRIRLDEIYFIEVNEKYCSFHLKNGCRKVNMRLKEVIDKLPADRFVQVHRSYVVAIEYIDQMDLNLKKLRVGDREVPVGRNFRNDLEQKLKQIG